jgi:hypothetical protein
MRIGREVDGPKIVQEMGIRSNKAWFEERRQERGSHLLERMPLLLVTDEFNAFHDLVHVMFQGGF